MQSGHKLALALLGGEVRIDDHVLKKTEPPCVPSCDQHGLTVESTEHERRRQHSAARHITIRASSLPHRLEFAMATGIKDHVRQVSLIAATDPDACGRLEHLAKLFRVPIVTVIGMQQRDLCAEALRQQGLNAVLVLVASGNALGIKI